VNIRPARKEDLVDVGALAGELVRMHRRYDPLRFMQIQNVEEGYRRFFAGEIARKGAIILAAERADDEGPADAPRVVGYTYASLEGRNWADLLDPCGKLNDLYVHPSFRRRGVARALVEATLAALRARGAPRVVLMSAWQNGDAHALFEALGFRRTMVEMTCELAPRDESR
jgi:ribosomal protein S18 acetylase RimI-like enzyme